MFLVDLAETVDGLMIYMLLIQVRISTLRASSCEPGFQDLALPLNPL